MIKIIGSLIIAFSFQNIAAQTTEAEFHSIKTDSIFGAEGLDTTPDFPGGLREFYKFVATNFKAPEIEKLNGKIMVTFVVEKDGSLTNFTIVDIGHGTGAEVRRMLNLSPKWIPAKHNGEPVRSLYSLPITIQAAK